MSVTNTEKFKEIKAKYDLAMAQANHMRNEWKKAEAAGDPGARYLKQIYVTVLNQAFAYDESLHMMDPERM